jgi:signal transduction histidine kinase
MSTLSAKSQRGINNLISVERAGASEVREAREKVLLEGMVTALLDAMPVCVLVLNRERQVLAVNRHLLTTFGIDKTETLIGKRPGEAVNCVHAAEDPGGCGCGKQCCKCESLLAIIESQQMDIGATGEFKLTINDDAITCLDIEVVATPLEVAGMRLTVLAMRDIGADKRRSMLERVFFHDLGNIVGALRALSELLSIDDFASEEKEVECKKWMVELTKQLVDEIAHQQTLLAAEKGECKPNLGIVDVGDILAEVRRHYVNHDIAEGRQLLLGAAPDVKIITDAAMLRRILGNMVKNALEATQRGGTVTMYCKEDTNHVSFCVNNPGIIPEETKSQLFHRSFSTKGEEGRGIGTYSIKLFGERYLKGKVRIVSDEPEGTTFCVDLPRHYSAHINLPPDSDAVGVSID